METSIDMQINDNNSVPLLSAQLKAHPAEEFVMNKRERALASLPQIMRYLGAIVLIASALSFAIQGWVGLDSLGRYYTFLGFTIVLSAAGVFCGVRLEEDKGARTFLALAAAFLPAHFIQLGAFVYNMFYGIPQGIPRYFVLTTPNPFLAAIALAIAIPTLTTIAFAGFSAMARVEARFLTLVYLLANTALLVPIRDANFIGAMSLLAFIGLTVIDVKRFSTNMVMKNWDGVATRTMLFIPIVCLLIRNLVLYPGTELMLSAMLAMLTLFLLFIAPQSIKSDSLVKLSQLISFATAAQAWMLFVSAVLTTRVAGLTLIMGVPYNDAVIPVTLLPLAIIFTLMSFVVRGTGAGYRRAASWLAIVAVLLQLFSVPGIISSLLCITTAVVTIVGAFAVEDRGLFYSGAFGLGVGILYHLRYAVDIYALSPWLSLAIMGIFIVVASSYIERNFSKMLETGTAFRKRLATWS